jgi:squalene-hopene/tetraprenyl-beta-curcumene cyclase
VNTFDRRTCLKALAGFALSGALTRRVLAADPAGPDPKEVKAVVQKAVEFLKTRQGKDGGFSGDVPGQGPGITAIVVVGLLRSGVSPDDPLVANGLKYLESKVQKDGGIYDKGLSNYVTSVALLAFKDANTDGKYDTLLKNASKFLKTLQYNEALVEDKDVKYGGVSYDRPEKGERSRPDLSNTQMFLEALLAAGVDKDDPAVKKALQFMSRCQNLPGETNDQAFAKKTTDEDKGGFVYNPLDADDPKSKRRTADGGLRSEGGMTYAGLKSFLYAGVDKKDPRVQAAVNWVRKHYTFKENPGLDQSGIYYYYQTVAKALTAWGEDPFVDADKKKHDWRKELFEELKSRQQANGSWVNKQDRAFGETNADLATGFALLAISYTSGKK